MSTSTYSTHFTDISIGNWSFYKKYFTKKWKESFFHFSIELTVKLQCMIKTSSLEPINLQVNSSMFADRSWNLSFSLGKCVSKSLSSRLREAAHDILKLSKAATTTSNHSLCHLQQLKIFLFSVCELKRRPKQKFPLNRTDLREDGGKIANLYHRGRPV